MSAPLGARLPAIQRFRAVSGDAEGRNQVHFAPCSIAVKGDEIRPCAMTRRQPAAMAMRAAASLVTMPPELHSRHHRGPAMASISGVSSVISG